MKGNIESLGELFQLQQLCLIPEILTGVVFGCKAEDADIELVRKWLADWPTPVALSMSKISTKGFDLETEVFDQVGGT